jgi:hypothetical protein
MAPVHRRDRKNIELRLPVARSSALDRRTSFYV